MSLPKQLIEAFESIKASRVCSGDFSRDDLREFVDLLNNAIPSPYNSSAYVIYRFNRFKYLMDKERFIADIKDFKPYDALILWTDFGHILAYFNLTGKIFLGWDKMKNRYRACPLTRPATYKNVQETEEAKQELVDVPDLQLGIESIAQEIIPEPTITVVSDIDQDVSNHIDNLDTVIANINNDDDNEVIDDNDVVGLEQLGNLIALVGQKINQPLRISF